MRIAVGILVGALLALAGQHLPARSDGPVTRALHGDCGTISQCVQKKVEETIALRGEYGQVTVRCLSTRHDAQPCFVLVGASSDDPACFYETVTWPDLRLVESLDVTQTLLCSDLQN